MSASHERIEMSRTPTRAESECVTEAGAPPPYSAFSHKTKWSIIAITSVASTLSPLSAQIYFPAIPTLATDFNKSISLMNLTVTVYMLSQGFSPMIWGPLTDSKGRRPVYIACLAILVGTCIGLALVPTNMFWLLLVLRILQSSGSASTVALAGGVVSDIAVPAERGIFMGVSTLGAMLGPSIGPVIGGLLAGRLGWRWIFWFLAIIAGMGLVGVVLFFPETLRLVVGDGSLAPPLWNRPWLPLLSPHTRNSVVETREETRARVGAKRNMNPLILFLNLDVTFTLLATAVAYALFMTVPASISVLFQAAYPYLNETTIGLCFLPVGGAGVISAFISGKIADLVYRQERAKWEATIIKVDGKIDPSAEDSFPVEYARLKLAYIYTAILVLSAIAYGWCIDQQVSIAGPLVFLTGIGYSGIGIINAYQTLLIDTFPGQGSSTVAMNNLVRCTTGAGLIAIVNPMLDRLGAGWTYTLLGLLTALFTPLLTLAVIKMGPKWRRQRKARQEAA